MLSPLLNAYDQVVLDLDGCVWVGGEITPGAVEALAELRSAHKGIVFLTNNSRLSPEEYVRKLWGLGVVASLEEVVTAGAAIQHVLAERASGRGAYVIGSRAVFRHVADAGARVLNGTPHAASAEVVVVCAYDGLRFAELTPATQAVLGGAEIIASDRDGTFPSAEGLVPGTGAVLAALEYATGRRGHAVGKPDPQIFRTALDRLGSGRTLVIGDRLDADLAGAAAAGLDGAVVLSGVSTREDAEAARDPAPVAIAENLHALLVS